MDIQTKSNDLGKDKISSLVLKLAIPSMIAQFVTVFYGIVDRIYIGNIKNTGNLALAGVGICTPITTLITSFGTLVGIGGSILVAISMGEKNHKKAEQGLANSFLMLTVMSIILTIIFLALKSKLLLWFGASNSTFPYANSYLTIYTIGTFFALMATGMNYFIICQGYSKIGMSTVLIGAILNIILDPIFIFVLDLGVAGASLATVLSQMASCIFVLITLINKKMPVHITFKNYSSKIMLHITKLGFSPFVILATDSILIIALNAVLQKFGGAKTGDTLIACATIVQSYMLLITSPMLGITGGTQPIISFNYGAKNANRVKQTIRQVLIICVLFTSIMFVLSRIIPPYFVRIFTNNTEYIKLSVWGIKVFTLGIIPLSLQYVFVDGLTALGLPLVSLSLSLFRKTLYFTLTILLPLFLAVNYTFMAEPIADIISALVSTITFLMFFKKHLRKRINEN